MKQGVYGPIIQGKSFSQPAGGSRTWRSQPGRMAGAAPAQSQAAAKRADPVRKRPVLGLLMQRWPGMDRPFGSQNPLAECVTTLARTVGVEVLCFGPEDVDRSARRVRGSRFLGHSQGWTHEVAPLPDVLWNRYLKRDQGALLHWLAQQSIPFINGAYLNKWETYQWLLHDEILRPHLPETALLTEAAVAFKMLERHPAIFLKPVAGAAGRGILRGRLSGPGLMQLDYISAATGGMKQVHVGSEHLDRWLLKDGRNGRYIVQQGLALNAFHGRIADLRVLVQKDGEGQWGITGMGCRVAGHGRFTANLHTGGQGVPAQLLFDAVYPDAAARERASEQVAELALRAARRIEEAAGPMGELGLDFGIDRSGSIWLIEQNGQPGRAVFEHMGRMDLSDLAHLRPVQYAKFLAARKGAGTPAAQAT